MIPSIAAEFLSACELSFTAEATDQPTALVSVLRSMTFPTMGLPGQPPGLTFRFRGQRNAEWGLTTSLFRAMSSPGLVVYEPPFNDREDAVLRQMRAEGLGRHMSDGELLMVLQHHGVPTRLLDVSTEPLEALYFAVDSDDGVDGRLFLLGVRDVEETLNMTGEEAAPLPWRGWRRGTTQSTVEWTNRIYALTDVSLDPRMRAQRGVFLVGGLPRSYGGQTPYRLHGKYLRAADVQQVTNLAVAFPAPGAKKKATVAAAVGWSLRIPAAWKEPLRHILTGFGIRRDTMYPPYAESRRLGEYIARQGTAE